MTSFLVLFCCLLVQKSSEPPLKKDPATIEPLFAAYLKHTEENPFIYPSPFIPREGTGSGKEPKLPEHLYPYEVRCPQGWYPSGPHCLTAVSVGTYTTCPGDKKQYRRGVKVDMQVTEGGVCAVTESVSPSLACPVGFSLQIDEIGQASQRKRKHHRFLKKKQEHIEDRELEFTKTFRCEGIDIIPIPLLAGAKCPLGYTPKLEGCVANQSFSPTISCPTGFTIGGSPLNDYAWWGKEIARCGRLFLYRGEVTCPKGFFPHELPYGHLSVGSRIEASDEKIKGSNTSVVDEETFQMIKDELNRLLKDGLSNLIEEEPQSPRYLREQFFPSELINSHNNCRFHFINGVWKYADASDTNCLVSPLNPPLASENISESTASEGDSTVILNLSGEEVSEDNLESPEIEHLLVDHIFSNLSDPVYVPMFTSGMGEERNSMFEKCVQTLGRQRHLLLQPLISKDLQNRVDLSVVSGRINQAEEFINLHIEQACSLNSRQIAQHWKPSQKKVQEGEQGEGRGDTETTLLDYFIQQVSQKPTIPTRRLQTNDSLDQFNMLQSNQLSCVLGVSVYEAHCTAYACETPFLKELEKTLRKWLYYRLSLDPDLAVQIIPSGKNIRYTSRT